MTLGLCSQIDLDFEVQRASKEKPAPADSGVTLLPAAVTTAPPEPAEPETPAEAKAKDDLDTAAVFAKLKQLGGKAEDKDERVVARLRRRITGPPAHPEHRAAGHRVDVVAGHLEAVLFVERDGAAVVLVDQKIEARRRDALAGVEQQRRDVAAPELRRDHDLVEIAALRIDGDEALDHAVHLGDQDLGLRHQFAAPALAPPVDAPPKSMSG